jgi:hypothetical protein
MNKLKNDLTEYNRIDRSNYKDIKLGTYIKYMKEDELKGGGFLVSINDDKKYTECYYMLKSNIVWKFRIYKYEAYYKKTLKETYDVKELEIKKEEIENIIGKKSLLLHVLNKINKTNK